MRILIVDHVWGQRQKILGWLAQGGYSAPNLLEAADGESALELLRSLDFSVDVILCDWLNPRVDGPSLFAQIRRLAAAPVDFIAMGEFDGPARTRALAAGAAEVIVQPIRPEMLLQKLLGIEKRRAGASPRASSQTSRFRLLAAEAAPGRPAPLSPRLWEALRTNCRHTELAAGERLPATLPPTRLWWVERGSLAIRETREGGATLAYRVGPEEFAGEFAFGGGVTTAFEAVAETDSWIAGQDADAVRRIVADQPVLFYYLRNISATRDRLYSRTGLPVEKGLSGTLESLPVMELLQMLHGARRTGVLRFDEPSGSIFLQFAGGQIVHAEGLGDVGESVVLQSMKLARGSFEFYVGPEIAGVRSVTTDMMKLLMTGAGGGR